MRKKRAEVRNGMEQKKGVFGICFRMVLKVYKKLHLWKIPIPGRDRVRADLSRLFPGENSEERITEYYVSKLTMSFLILSAGVLLTVLVMIGKGDKSPIKDGRMQRTDYETGAKEYAITGKVEEGPKYSFIISVKPRKYKKEELQKFFDDFRKDLPELIRGDNPSLECVSSALNLQEEYEGYPFWIEWQSDRPDIVSAEGAVSSGGQTDEVQLTAILSHEEYQWETSVSVIVREQASAVPKSERTVLEEMLEDAQTQGPEQESFVLPSDIDGKRIIWQQKRTTELQILLGTVLTMAAVFFFKDRDTHALVEKKKQEEKQKYPEILQKITLYIEAGLTVRAAVGKVAEDYEKERKKGAREQPAYEELLVAVREIRMGMSEGAAYENFGKRTGVREYIRLSTFLTQNVKKGSSMLTQQLREEAKAVEEMRINRARKLGEEASTKLLIPMMLLLLVVMILIMYPAFSNVGV